jgi:hypothetical protein
MLKAGALFPVVITNNDEITGDADWSICEISTQNPDPSRDWYGIDVMKWLEQNGIDAHSHGCYFAAYVAGLQTRTAPDGTLSYDQNGILTVCHVLAELLVNFPDIVASYLQRTGFGRKSFYVNLQATYGGQEIHNSGNSFGLACFVAFVRFLREQYGWNRHMAYTGAINGTDVGTKIGHVMKTEIKKQIEEKYGLMLFKYYTPGSNATGQIDDLNDLFGGSGYTII